MLTNQDTGSFTAPIAPVTMGLSHGEMAKRITQIVGIVAVTLFLVASFSLYMLNVSIQSEQAQEATKEGIYGTSEQISQRYDRTLAEYTATTTQLQYLEKSVASNEFIPTLLPQITQLGESYNLSVSSIKPGILSGSQTATSVDGSGPTSTYQLLPITVSISGTYTQIMHFIYGLAKFPKIVTVKNISLHPSSGSAPTGGSSAPLILAADLSLDAYIFTPDPKTDSALPPIAPVTGTTGAGSVGSASTGVAGTTANGTVGVSTTSSSYNQATPATAATSPRVTSSTFVDQNINRPIAAAQDVQSQTQTRVEGAGLQAEPAPAAPQTSLGRGSSSNGKLTVR